MADLTISTVDLGLGAVSVTVNLETVTPLGTRKVAQNGGGHLLVDMLELVTSEAGLLTVNLPASADLTWADGTDGLVCYQATVKGYQRLFEKGASSENLVDTGTPTPVPDPEDPLLVLNDLADVDTSGAAAGEVLTYDGAGWIPGDPDAPPPPDMGLDDLNDVDTSGASTGEVLVYDGTGWVPGDPDAAPPPAMALDDLTDVDTSGATGGNVLVYDGTDWVPGIGGGGGTVDTVVAGDGITVDATDPANPIVAAQVNQAELDAKVAKAGDTMTGNLSVGDHSITATDVPGGGNATATLLKNNLQIQAANGSVNLTHNRLDITRTGATPTTALIVTGDGVTQVQVLLGGWVRSPVDPSNANDLTRKSWVDTQLATKVAKTGDTMTGDLTVSGSGGVVAAELVGGTAPRLRVAAGGVPTDAVLASFGTISGAATIHDDGNVRSPIDPSHADDLTRKSWVDTQIAGAGTAAAALVDDLSGVTNQATARTNLGLGDVATQNEATLLGGELSSIKALTSQADRVPYYTGADTAALATFTSYGRSIAALANRAAHMALLGLTFADIAGGTSTMPGGGTIKHGDLGGFPTVPALAFRSSGVAYDSLVMYAGGFFFSDALTGTLQANLTGIAGGLSIGSAKFQSSATPTVADDFTRKGYVDSKRRTNAEVLPTGVIAQTLPRWSNVGNLTSLVSGTLLVCAVNLGAGEIVSNISWMTRTTAASGHTNHWFVLLDENRVVRAVSADATTAAWGVNSLKTLAMTAAYTIPTDGPYHLGVMVAGTTVPSLSGLANATANLTQFVPMIVATSSTGLTTPPALGATMGAYTVLGTGVPYAHCS